MASSVASNFLKQDTTMENSLMNNPHVKINFLRSEIESVSKLITEDVFQMIDNLTQAMTENEGEINELKESLYTQNRLINKQREEI